MSWYRRTCVLVLMAACCAALAACGSSGSSSSSTAESSGSTAAKGGSSPEATSESGVDMAAAEKLTAPYTGHPTAFPVDEPLKERPPADTTIAYLQCSSPFCALMGEQLEAATKAMGVKLNIVKAGSSVSEAQSAMSSVIAQKPDGVVIPAIEEQIPKQLEELNEMGIPVAGGGVSDPEKYGIDINFNGAEVSEHQGRVLAAWAVEQEGAAANAVFYNTPELSFSNSEEKGFNDELKNLCASCTTRSVTLTLAEFGNKAPAHVVSDLQSNPETNVAIFGSQEGAEGLPAQLKTAGLENIKINGTGGTPSNLQDIQAGNMTATLGVDIAPGIWAMVDGISRLVTGQPLAEGEEHGAYPAQLLEQKDLEGENIEKGFVAYPENAERFEKLWGGK